MGRDSRQIPDLDLGGDLSTVDATNLVNGVLHIVGVIPGVGHQIVETPILLMKRILASTLVLGNRLPVIMILTRRWDSFPARCRKHSMALQKADCGFTSWDSTFGKWTLRCL